MQRSILRPHMEATGILKIILNTQKHTKYKATAKMMKRNMCSMLNNIPRSQTKNQSSMYELGYKEVH